MSTRVRPGLQWSEGAAGPVLEALASDKAQDWREYAACAQADPDAWFPEQGESSRPARQICAGCFVRVQCLAYALAAGEAFGIYGGLSERERRRLKARAAA